MVKYTEISDVNNDQIELINKNGWCIFTECDGNGTYYYHKGIHWVNRIEYIILSENVDIEDINSHKELNKIATYDDTVNSNPRIPFVTQDSLFVNENPVL